MKQIKLGTTILGAFVSESGEQAISFWDPSTKKGIVKIVREVSGGQWPAAFSIYGPTATRSDYDFEQAVATATPAQLTYLMPRVKEVRTCIFLLFFKQLEIVNAETGFYSFQSEHLRGFQNGDPLSAKTTLRLKGLTELTSNSSLYFPIGKASREA